MFARVWLYRPCTGAQGFVRVCRFVAELWRRLAARARGLEWAVAAEWPPCLADAAAVVDEQHVKRETVVGRHDLFQHVVGIIGRRFGTDETQTSGDPVDVRVDGHGRHPKGEREHHGRSLWADARQVLKPGLGLVERHLAEELDIEFAAFVEDRGQYSLDSHRLLIGEAPASYGVCDIYIGRGYDGGPGGVSCPQRPECPLGVQVGGVLGQDGEDQFVERV